jgi:hypothetical protein
MQRKIMKKIAKISILLILIVFVGCSSPEPINESATKVTIHQIENNPDFHWFNPEYADYTTDAIYVDSLSDIFNASQQNFSFVIYTAPNCLCGQEYTLFPRLIKVLDGAGISEEHYEIYVMNDTSYSQPYDTLFDVPAIPAFAIMTNSDQSDAKQLVSIWDYAAVKSAGMSIEQLLYKEIKFASN